MLGVKMRAMGGLMTGTPGLQLGKGRGTAAESQGLAAARRLLTMSCVALLGACSLLVDANGTQCETDADCPARGASFAGTAGARPPRLRGHSQQR
jgi:hypothetical protein